MKPVFIVGCQRSGSTMLGAMLGAHKDCVCVPESSFLTELLPGQDGSQLQNPSAVIDNIESHWRFQAWNFPLKGRRPAEGETEPTFRGAIEWLVEQYAASADRHDATIWIEQEPNYVRTLWRMQGHFPDARFIHIIRDGRAVAASLMARDWGPNAIPGAAAYWQSRIAAGLAAGLYFTDKQYINVRYEDIVLNPDQEIRRIAEFLGLEFDPIMLKPTGLRLPNFTKYQHELIGKPLTPDRVEAWRNRLTWRQIEIFEELTGDLLPYLGYSLLTGPNRPKFTEIEKVSLYARDYAKRLLNRIGYLQRRRGN